MENAQQTQPNAAPRGRPFQPGNPGGPGRRKVTPEEKEAKRLAERAADRVVNDVMAELRSMTGPAVDRLRKLIDDKDPGVALRAATDVLNRVNGLPVSTSIVASIGEGEPVRRITADDLRQAALKLLATQAIDVQAREVE